MQFSFGKKESPASAPSADDKLQRAIERNKKKMQQRQARMSSSGSSSSSLASKLRQTGAGPDQIRKPSTSSSILERMRANKSAPSSSQASSASMNASRANRPSGGSSAASSLADKLRRNSAGTPPEIPGSREMPQRSSMSSSSGLGSMNSGPARRPVTSADSIEMQAPVRRNSLPAKNVDYETTRVTRQSKSTSRKVKKKKTFELASWFVKGAWLFCGFLILRLLFSEGGIVEYQQTKASYVNMQKELADLKVENENLMIELKNMKESSLFQKKLVRDHLGYIDKNEYLVLFSND